MNQNNNNNMKYFPQAQQNSTKHIRKEVKEKNNTFLSNGDVNVQYYTHKVYIKGDSALHLTKTYLEEKAQT